MSKHHDTEKTVRFEVSFGPSQESEREVKSFSDEADAVEFFKKKDKAGMHVDAYEINTVITRRKLTV